MDINLDVDNLFEENNDDYLCSLDESEIDSENLSDPGLERYIVTFYREYGQEDTWCGHGVLVADYLITVAHVMIDKETKNNISYLYYKCNRQFKRVDSSDMVFDGRDGLDDDVDDIHHDLIIFKVKGINSPFVLNSASFNMPLSVYAWTYRGCPQSSFGSKYKILRQNGFNYDPAKIKSGIYLEWKNCLLVTGDFISGNSGTPIYRHNIIYGLLIGGTEHKDCPFNVYNFLDARYIQKMLLRI